MIEDVFILQLETATPVCSVAVAHNGKTVARVEADGPNLHASHLTLFIEQALVEAGLVGDELAAVAVSMGPGSYTGLRIGVSTAKGLCYALDIPLIAVNTLEAMAHGFCIKNDGNQAMDAVLVPMIDARRMEVYMAKYNFRLQVLEEAVARIIDANSFPSVGKDSRYILFGSGADKFADFFSGNDEVHVETGFRNAASFFDLLAYKRYKERVFEDVVYFEPYYLKDFIATTPKKR